MTTSNIEEAQLDEVIRRAYQIVGEPERLVELQSTIEINSRTLGTQNGTLDAHFEQANRLLELVPKSEDQDFSRFGMDGHLVPDSADVGVLLRLDERLHITRVDEPDYAQTELTVGDNFLDWVASEGKATDAELRNLAAGDEATRAVVVRFFTGLDDDRGHLGLAVKAKPTDCARVLIRQIGLKWSQRDEQAFAAAFSLTVAEIQLVRSLVEAKGVKGFAKARGSMVSTARTQLKRLQKKLAVCSQGEIISLYAGFVGLLSSDSLAASRNSSVAEQGGEVRVRGEVIRYHRYGPPGGRPILMLHGALEGPFLPRKVVDEVIAHDLNLLVPWMPFYTGVETDLSAKERIDSFAERLPDLLDELGIEACPIIACSLSTAYAFAAIAAHPDRYSGLALAGMALPLTETQDKSAMNPAWRAPLELGARFPRFFELFARTIFRLALRGEVHHYFDRLFKDSPMDLASLREPDVANTMRIAAQNRTDRFGAAMAHGFVVMTLDWSEWLSRVKVPVKLVVGGQDVIGQPEELLGFAERYGFEALGPVDSVAGFALFQDPALVLREASALLPRDQTTKR